jgi:hypothetical protein
MNIHFLFAQTALPSAISNLQLWLKADAGVIINSSAVSQWSDQSSVNNHCIQNTLVNRPTQVVNVPELNGNSAIRFDGTNDFLIGTTLSNINNSSFTIFVVANGESQSSSIASLFSVNTASNGFYFTRRPSINKFSIFNQNATINSISNFPSIGYNYRLLSGIKTLNTSFSFRVNSTQDFNSTSAGLTTSFTNTNYQLGAGNSSNFFKGDIAEIILYDRALSLSEISQVELYLMNKYAPPVNLGADINDTYGFCDIELQPTGYFTNYLWNTGATSSTINVNAPGTYWVQGTDVFGRQSYDSIVIIRPHLTEVALTNQLVCFNDISTINPPMPNGAYNFIQWSDGNTNPVRELNQNETISYTVSDSLGCTRTSNLATITLDNSLENVSLGLDTNLCSGNTIHLVQDTSAITTWLWNTGDTTETLAIDTSGIYQLEVSNGNNCSNRDTIQVTVIGTSPTLQYTFTDSLCQYIEGQFLDNSFVANGNGTINNKTWSISEGSFYSGSSGTFVIDTAGTFNVTLLVETVEGCSSSTTFPLTVHPKPILSFTNQNYCPYDVVQFAANNSQLSSLSSHLWQFGDNTSSTLSNPAHVFGSSGIYNATLQAEDINGCRDTVMQEVYIQPAPFADFSFNNTCEETEVNFVNNSNIVDTFNITFNTWFYGDGTQAINPSFQKTYADADTFDVQLIVTANNGCQDTSMQSIIIYPRPTLGWQVGPACKNAWTTFENFSSVSVGNITQTDWLVNLQYPLEGTSSAYQFVTTGVQYLNLTSTTDNGCQRDTLIIVNVQPEINASYIVSPQTIVAGVPTTFTSTSTGATEYTWNLGNGNIIQTTVAEPVEATGFDASLIGDSIQTSLIIENTIGCKDTATQYIKIFEPRIDLAITQLFVQDLNGFYKVGVELSNQGFIEITQTDLVLKMYGSLPILETENESLSPGESRIYLFNASPSAYISTQDNETSYLCVEATSYNDYQLIETELKNNISCLNTEGENFVLLPIYPNPTNDDISYSFILSEEATIKTSLTDETGRIVMEQSELHPAGLHTQLLSMRNLSAGVYYFHISDGTSAKTVKILKN